MDTLARHRARAGPWRDAVATLLAAVLPVRCAGCGMPDVGCCARCASFLREPAAPWLVLAGRHPPDLADLPGYALCRYDGPITRLLTEWKDRGRADLTPLISAGLARAALPLVEASAADGCGVLLVPVPTSAAGIRRRGEDLLLRAVDSAASRLRRRGLPVECRPLLRHVARVADQSGLTAHQRRANVHGAYRVRSSAGQDQRARRYLLIDDVVTTGATVSEARDAARRGGIELSGAVSLAATPHHASLD